MMEYVIIVGICMVVLGYYLGRRSNFGQRRLYEFLRRLDEATEVNLAKVEEKIAQLKELIKEADDRMKQLGKLLQKKKKSRKELSTQAKHLLLKLQK